jgi:UDP-N-acetylmuramoyl-tripeptide--D-alanyl-D-alanine ligase
VVGDAGSVHAGAVLEGSWGSESRHVDTAQDVLLLVRDELTADDVILVAGLPEVLTALEGAA